MPLSGKFASSAHSYDWSGSRLGAPEAWPASLRLAADLVLNLPCPALVVWGRGMNVLFNEAYSELVGPAYGPVPGGSVPPVMPPPLAAAPDELACAWRGEAAVATSCALAIASPDPRLAAMRYDLHFTPIRGEAGVEGVAVALAPAAPEPARPQESAGPLHILVVEDNIDSQYLVCEMLRAFGHEADGVGHPDDALAHLAQRRYDVLFTDVSLPGMSGVELARKAVADAPATQVIFASGYGDTLLRHVEFPYLSLQKPYEIDQLQQALDQVAQQVPART